jgi:hypothetical protein
MYDIIPGEPFHAKGEGNGYVVTIGGVRIYLAGVTECTPEMQAVRDVDIAFVPMNLPHGRMPPAVAADCVRIDRAARRLSLPLPRDAHRRLRGGAARRPDRGAGRRLVSARVGAAERTAHRPVLGRRRVLCRNLLRRRGASGASPRKTGRQESGASASSKGAGIS